MRHVPLLTPMILALVLCGCARQEPRAGTGVDIERAARDAQGMVNAYGENVAGEEASAPDAIPAAPPSPTTAAVDRSPLPEAHFAPDSAQGAADVVQTYYALIGEGRYAQARRLWRPGAAGAGANDAAFAAGFARYAEYRATVGAPGAIDAGAGQLYVTVPVRISARLKRGTALDERGRVALHRTNDIDGATREQRTWHLQSIDLDPPTAPAVKR